MRDIMNTLASSVGKALQALTAKPDMGMKELVEELGKLRDNVVKAKSAQEKLDLIRAKAQEIKDKYFQSKQEGKPEEDLNQLAFDFAQEEKKHDAETTVAGTIVQETTNSAQTVDSLLGPMQSVPDSELDAVQKAAVSDAVNSSREAKRVCSEISQLMSDAARWGAQVDRDLAAARANLASTMDSVDSLVGPPSDEEVKRARAKLEAEMLAPSAK